MRDGSSATFPNVWRHHLERLAPPSSQPCESKTHQKRRAGFGHRNQRPACEYGVEPGAGEVGVDVVESGSERSAQSYGISKDRADQDRVGQVRAGQVRAGQVRVEQVRGAHVRAEQVRAGQVSEGQVRVEQVRAGQVRAGQVRVDQVCEGQVRVGQIRAGQVRERLDVRPEIGVVTAAEVRAGLDGINNRPINLLILSRESGDRQRESNKEREGEGTHKHILPCWGYRAVT